jgi:hypothetical protein
MMASKNQRHLVIALLACLLIGADQPADVPPANMEALSPRQRIEQMSAADREQLAREARTFADLSAEEQDRLRQLHERLQAEPELRRVMVEYHQWLKTLQPLERAELLAMDPAQRVEQIRKLKQQQEAQAARRIAGNMQLSDADFQAVFRWLEELAVSHQEQLLREIPPERRDQIQKLPGPQRRRQLAMAAGMRMGMGTPLGRLLAEEADLNQLRQRLTPDAQTWLDKAQTRAQKLELLQSAVQVRRLAQDRRRLPFVNEQDLEEFFAKELTAQERDRLLEMPREDMQRELRRMYVQRKGLDRPDRPRPLGPDPRGGGGRGPRPMPEGAN